MAFRKPLAATPWTQKEKYYTFANPQFRNALLFVLFLSVWLFLLFFCFRPIESDLSSHATQYPSNGQNPTTAESLVSKPACDAGLLVYMYDLPPQFNLGLLKDCKILNMYSNMCPYVAFNGLGQPVDDMGSGSSDAWFATHQFMAEMIFHARMENHPCRTRDPSRASLFYVPFYGGLYASSKFREGNHTARDELAVRLVEYIQSQPWWGKNHGQDHFLALGRTAWDFMRRDNGNDFGANCLLNLPAVQNMSVLTVERQPWTGSNQFGIPYPSYFHPSTWNEMVTWQRKMRQTKRTHLFSFIGGPRKGLAKAAIRDELIRQCDESTCCKLLKCVPGEGKCHKPSQVLAVMTSSQFCLQAPGDSFTRRSTFDAVVAGCIPVFFSTHTAYSQYKWFLPGDPTEYSVYMDEKGKESRQIEKELLKIPSERVERMRSRVIDMIPRLTYAHPNASDSGFQDAVDVALSALAAHVGSRLGFLA